MPFLAKEHVPIPKKDLISWIFDDIGYDSDMPVYIDAADPSKSISARQARSMIRRLVAGFHSAGLQKGDAVCVHSFNNLYYPITVLGIIGAGCVYTGTNPAYTPRELTHHISVTKAKLFLVEPELLSPVLEAMKRSSIDSSKVFLFDPYSQQNSELPSWQSLLDHGEQDWVRFEDENESKNTTAMRLTTSGTTGLPKAAELSHHNLVSQHTLVWESQIPKKPYDLRTIIALPMFHAAMAPMVHTSALRSGFVMHLMRKFDVDEFMAAIHKYRPTEIMVVPPVVLRIVMSPNVKNYDFSCLKRATVGAAPLDPDLQQRFENLIDGAVTQVWGMTESSCVISMTPYPESGLATVGYLLPNHDIKFVNDNGEEILESNVPGEMCVRGPNIIRGYFNDPVANSRDFDADGFYHSGDVGYIEKSTGKLYIVDRKKELIKVRGFQVAPNEIEGILLSHPSIIDAAVIGLSLPSSPDAELVQARVVLREGDELSEREVLDYVQPQLASYKHLTGGVKFVPTIPKTASGKILKRLLREEALREIKAETAKL
ncbi:uncharacterized protein PV09_06747 [Verruconis gallopava]|uniref:AMP-dependent synthetase/ligase domain-containing protein n=1 Tax=Verruconis gallopava TaxID=253628 RepID=A0A0D1XI14_9PEZI|nr:uncharacterized protein PV09_06747 [Verruconis gallopava]KIW01906.1 hypothetical protein PV09_06747 [Verruconis gallopava]